MALVSCSVVPCLPEFQADASVFTAVMLVCSVVGLLAIGLGKFFKRRSSARACLFEVHPPFVLDEGRLAAEALPGDVVASAGSAGMGSSA